MYLVEKLYRKSLDTTYIENWDIRWYMSLRRLMSRFWTCCLGCLPRSYKSRAAIATEISMMSESAGQEYETREIAKNRFEEPLGIEGQQPVRSAVFDDDDGDWINIDWNNDFRQDACVYCATFIDLEIRNFEIFILDECAFKYSLAVEARFFLRAFDPRYGPIPSSYVSLVGRY